MLILVLFFVKGKMCRLVFLHLSCEHITIDSEKFFLWLCKEFIDCIDEKLYIGKHFHKNVKRLTLSFGCTVWKVSKYGVFPGPYFPAFGLNTESTPYLSVFSPNVGKYGPEKTPYLDTFCAVMSCQIFKNILKRQTS